MTDTINGRAADNGGKYDEGVKKAMINRIGSSLKDILSHKVGKDICLLNKIVTYNLKYFLKVDSQTYCILVICYSYLYALSFFFANSST